MQIKASNEEMSALHNSLIYDSAFSKFHSKQRALIAGEESVKHLVPSLVMSFLFTSKTSLSACQFIKLEATWTGPLSIRTGRKGCRSQHHTDCIRHQASPQRILSNNFATIRFSQALHSPVFGSLSSGSVSNCKTFSVAEILTELFVACEMHQGGFCTLLPEF